ncbi:hypothetical protein V2K77_08690 [Pseudomonas alliivorans]|nr:hypothetical protein [Pseudomonas alliivorans]MEE4690151.1 hypothetical protein [Pseudomonas alliivorans]MEE4713155.1 hypothetical protein [Pseudomonas alliivorans]MEE4728734.1 hypothetical protein [Pseudomonas alliivorans]MEE4767954.1 hypothetical protein [Pseudomonas alliivorans]
MPALCVGMPPVTHTARPTVAPAIFTYSKTVEPGMIARPIHPEV